MPRDVTPSRPVGSTTVEPRAPAVFLDGKRVIGGVSGDAHESVAMGRVEQIENGDRIITRRLGQRVDEDHAGLIDAKVGASASHACCGNRVSRLPTHLPRRWTDPCRRARDRRPLPWRDRPQSALQMLTAPGERGYSQPRRGRGASSRTGRAGTLRPGAAGDGRGARRVRSVSMARSE